MLARGSDWPIRGEGRDYSVNVNTRLGNRVFNRIYLTGHRTKVVYSPSYARGARGRARGTTDCVTWIRIIEE